MKKTFRKITSLTLVLLLVFSVFSVQASAGLFDKIESVLVSDKAVVTAREIDYYIEIMDEYGWEDEYDYEYTVYPDMFVMLSTGEVIETSDYGYGTNGDGKRTVEVYSYVDVRDYLDAKENGEDTIPLYYEMVLLSSIGVEMDTVSGEAEIKIIDCFVRSITPVSGVPGVYRDLGYVGGIVQNIVYADSEFELEGAVFDIEYADGSVERATVSTVTDEDGYEYYDLNGEEIYYYLGDEENVVEIYYMDACYEHPVEYIPFPISEIVIDEVKVSDAFEAESVSYTVTKSDGSTQSFTYNFDSEPLTTILGMEGYVAETVDDAYVIILLSKGYTDDYPSKEIMEVVVFADLYVMATEEVEGPAQEDNFLNRLIYKIRMFIMRIYELFYYFY